MADRSMSRTGLVLAGLAFATSGCTPMDDLLVSIFGRSMREQPSISSYEGPRNPPVGAVSFASGNFPAGAFDVNIGQPSGSAIPAPVTVATMAQVVLDNPVAADEESLARGRTVFERACAPCHGATGAGDGPVAQTAMIFTQTLLGPTTVALTDGYIYSIIRIGRARMPAYGHQVSHYDRWHVVNYVRQLQGQ